MISNPREVVKIKNSLFRNSRHKDLTLDQVYEMLVSFLKQAPHNEYRLSIGTDSQVGTNETVFVTAIHLHKIGKGATGFFTTQVIPRPLFSLRKRSIMKPVKPWNWPPGLLLKRWIDWWSVS